MKRMHLGESDVRAGLAGHFYLSGLVVAGVLAGAMPAAAESAREKIFSEARQDYEETCMACHGADATGQGDLAEHLIKPPKDLTAIASRSNGAFPFWRVFDIIAGEEKVPGHETFHMPQYSERMAGQAREHDYLPAHVRILELTHYLESIQKK